MRTKLGVCFGKRISVRKRATVMSPLFSLSLERIIVQTIMETE